MVCSPFVTAGMVKLGASGETIISVTTGAPLVGVYFQIRARCGSDESANITVPLMYVVNVSFKPQRLSWSSTTSIACGAGVSVCGSVYGMLTDSGCWSLSEYTSSLNACKTKRRVSALSVDSLSSACMTRNSTLFQPIREWVTVTTSPGATPNVVPSPSNEQNKSRSLVIRSW